jgi:hypothetical protein
MTVDRNSPDYLAGRADMANEFLGQVRTEDAPSGKKPIRNAADVAGLTQAEVNERWDEVQVALAKGGDR